MSTAATTYDLVLLLDPQAEEPARAKIVADTRSAIEAKGELLRHDQWGERALTYPIERRASAEYHLLQFHVGDGELLSGLDHTLRITDGLLRFRIVKLKPGVPDAPEMEPSAPRKAEAEAEVAAASPAAASEEPAPAAEEPAADEAPSDDEAQVAEPA